MWRRIAPQCETKDFEALLSSMLGTWKTSTRVYRKITFFLLIINNQRKKEEGAIE
jgi:hypothetical protein